ncbi:MAG: RHS repeat-associated core domain-containing protein [Planctomycetia bacterium]|nr:RHS repeat-associated core domain-containing protein [Planctomycetia bacterium]
MYYNAFGKPTIYNGSLAVQRNVSNYAWTRTFTGQVYDPESGLMLYRNRYYHPTLGRFITRDPIGYNADGVNLFRYLCNSSVNRLDLLGLKSNPCQENHVPPPWDSNYVMSRPGVFDEDDVIDAKEQNTIPRIRKPKPILCREIENTIRKRLTTTEEKKALNHFFEGSAYDRTIPSDEVNKILENSDFFTQLKKKVCNNDCVNDTTVPISTSYPWAGALGSATIHVNITRSGNTIFGTAEINDPYDFDPKFFNTHRTWDAELKTLSVRIAQLMNDCHWKEFCFKGKAYGTLNC